MHSCMRSPQANAKPLAEVPVVTSGYSLSIVALICHCTQILYHALGEGSMMIMIRVGEHKRCMHDAILNTGKGCLHEDHMGTQYGTIEQMDSSFVLKATDLPFPWLFQFAPESSWPVR